MSLRGRPFAVIGLFFETVKHIDAKFGGWRVGGGMAAIHHINFYIIFFFILDLCIFTSLLTLFCTRRLYRLPVVPVKVIFL